MSGILNTLITIGALVGAVVVFQHRCDWFQFCGGLGDIFGTGAAAADPVSETVVTEVPEPVAEVPVVNTTKTTGCCVCEIRDGKAMCKKNGGAWFNPGRLNGVKNDHSVELSLAACNANCSKTTTTSKPPAAIGTAQYRASNEPGTGNLGEKGTTYSTPRYSCTSGLCAPGSSGRSTAACSHCSRSSSGSGSTGSGSRAPASGSSSSTPRLQTGGTARIGTAPSAPARQSSVTGSGQPISDSRIRNAWAGNAYISYPEQIATFYAQRNIRPFRAFSGRLSI